MVVCRYSRLSGPVGASPLMKCFNVPLAAMAREAFDAVVGELTEQVRKLQHILSAFYYVILRYI